MSPTIHHISKYFHCTVQRAKDRRQQFHFCRLPFDVTWSLISLMFNIVATREDHLSWNWGKGFEITWWHLLPNVSEKMQCLQYHFGQWERICLSSASRWNSSKTSSICRSAICQLNSGLKLSKAMNRSRKHLKRCIQIELKRKSSTTWLPDQILLLIC